MRSCAPDNAHTAEQLRQFVECLYDASDLVEIRLLPSRQSMWHRASEVPKLHDQLAGENQMGQHVYVGVNARTQCGGRSTADVARARCLFADFDKMASSEARSRWQSVRLPDPTMIVASGHGVHAYWRLSSPITDLSAWSNWQRDLAALLGSDPAVHDPPRLTRLPGFVNHKAPTAPCLIVDADPSRDYDLADLHERIPEQSICAPTKRGTVVNCNPREVGRNGLAVVARAATYLDKVPGAIEGQNGDSHTYRTACTLVRDFDLSIDQAFPLMLTWNQRCSPPWSEKGLRKKLRNAAKYGKNAGGCKAKQPASNTSVPPTDSLPDNPGPGWYTIGDLHKLPVYTQGLPPISTGFTVLDEALRGGLRPECVYVLGGRTGTSKSTLALNVARKVALDGHSVLVFKLEESRVEAIWRMHAAAAQVRLACLLNGADRVDDETRRKLSDGWELIHDLPIRVSDNRHLEDIQRISRAHVDMGGRLIVVDQLSMIAVPNVETGYPQATMASNTLRLLARDLHVPIVTVVQVNRPAAKKKQGEHLTVNDLRDSGAIENDATAVILIDRVRDPDGPRRNTREAVRYVDIIVGKNRYGPTTDPDRPLTLVWWPAMCRIEDLAPVPEGAG